MLDGTPVFSWLLSPHIGMLCYFPDLLTSYSSCLTPFLKWFLPRWHPVWHFGKGPLGVEQEQTDFSVKLSVAFLTTSTVCLDFLAKHKVTLETQNGEDPRVTEEMRYRQWPCTDYGSQASQEGSGPVLSTCSGPHLLCDCKWDTGCELV